MVLNKLPQKESKNGKTKNSSKLHIKEKYWRLMVKNASTDGQTYNYEIL